MSGDIQRYLVDTNVLFRLPRQMRTDQRFHEVAQFPSEVVYETRQYAAEYDLPPLEYKTTPSVLRHLKAVMSRVAVDDFDLIDLYAGEGAADPLLVACALDGIEKRSEVLVGEVYTVVSHDQAVRDACKRHTVPCLGALDLISQLTSDATSGTDLTDREVLADQSEVSYDI